MARVEMFPKALLYNSLYMPSLIHRSIIVYPFVRRFYQSQDNLIIKNAELICDWLKDEQNIEGRFISGRHLAVY